MLVIRLCLCVCVQKFSIWYAKMLKLAPNGETIRMKKEGRRKKDLESEFEKSPRYLKNGSI